MTSIKKREQVAPVVLKSMDEVKIRWNARDINVAFLKLREKMKDLVVPNGSVVANVLDKANVRVNVSNPSELDIRVNGKPASLLQVVNDSDVIYLAPKVDGGGSI